MTNWLKSRFLGVANDWKFLLAIDPNKFERGAVRAIRLAASEARPPWPPPTLSLHKIFNYILLALYTGCQWKMLSIETNAEGLPKIHYTRIYRAMQRWQTEGFIDQIFAGSVRKLHQDGFVRMGGIAKLARVV